MSRCRPKVSRSSNAGNDWHTLDFGDIEKELAAKLSDDNINDILVHINAANKVKRLHLTNCINITGAGLISLRGSTSIEQIDLSLVGAHQRARIHPEPPISYDLLLPILDSIISQERCSLKQIQFPHVWRIRPAADPGFIELLQRYNEMMGNRDAFFCGKCNIRMNMSDCIYPHDDGFFLEYKNALAASALRVTATDAAPVMVISPLLDSVEPVSVNTAQSVRRWLIVVLVTT